MNLQHITTKLALFMVMAFICFQTTAQEKRLSEISVEEISEKQTKILTEKLDLEKKEVQRLREINLKYANEVKELRKEGRSKETREKLEKLNHEHNAEVKKVLSEDDFGEYLVLKRKMHKRMQKKANAKRKEARVKKQQRMRDRVEYMEKLNLSDNQKKEIKTIREKYRQQREAIMAVGRSKVDREKLEALRIEQNKEVSEILNDDQYKLYLEMQEKRMLEMQKHRRKQ